VRASAPRRGKSRIHSLEEFVEHAIEKHLATFEAPASRDDVVKKLKGLGYLK